MEKKSSSLFSWPMPDEADILDNKLWNMHVSFEKGKEIVKPDKYLYEFLRPFAWKTAISKLQLDEKRE